jgi:NitT/TauT family transport system permease protein
VSSSRRFGARIFGGWRRGIVGFAVLVLGLDLVSRSGLVHEYYFPPASQVMRSSIELLSNTVFLGHVGNTVYVSLVGLALTCVIGIPLGMVLGASDLAYRASISLVEIVRPVPAVALIPIAILALGTGSAMKISLVVIGGIWPVLFNTIYGMRSVDVVAKETARAYGCSELQVLRRVAFPSALPMILTGVRIAAALALVLAISAEMLSGAQRGIGVWLLLSGQTGVAPSVVYGGTLLAGLLGWGSNALIAGAQFRLLPWTRDIA